MATRKLSPRATSELPATSERVVRVKVSPQTLYDFDRITHVLGKVLDRLGCRACCSGHDIRFEIERDFIADAKGNVRPI